MKESNRLAQIDKKKPTPLLLIRLE